MLRKFSSTFRRKSTSRQNSGEVGTKPHPDTIEEKAERAPQPTSKSRKAGTTREEQIATVESLRKRLEAELRPDPSNDSLHQTQLDQNDVEHPIHCDAVNPAGKRTDEKLSSLAIRKPSTKRNQHNIFGSLESSAFKSDGKPKAVGQRLPRDGQNGSTEKEDSEQENLQHLTSVALASVSDTRKSWRAGMRAGNRAPWQHADPHAYTYQIPAQTLLASMSAPINAARVSSRSSAKFGSSDGGSGGGSGSGSECSNLPVVVARAVCEMEHPRPSRSSEARLLKVLVADKEEGLDDSASGKRQGSQDSETSFHTAREARSG